MPTATLHESKLSSRLSEQPATPEKISSCLFSRIFPSFHYRGSLLALSFQTERTDWGHQWLLEAGPVLAGDKWIAAHRRAAG